MSPAIRTEKLSKSYGSLKAVDSIDLSVERGELFGFLGPNGAGKTTTISILVTLLQKSSGKAFVNGFDVSSQQSDVRKSIGIVFQDPSVDEELTAYENLELHGLLYDVPQPLLSKRIKEVLSLVGLWPKRNILVKNYSGGMKRRLEIARGFLHRPKILFLDEPTLGLDPQTRRAIWDHIRKLNSEEGITVILTTHYMEEAGALCSRIAVIDQGKIIARGTPEELKRSIGGDIIRLSAIGNCSKLFKAVNGVSRVSKNKDGSYTITADNAEKTVPLLFKQAVKCKATISAVSIHEPTLEDVFLKMTGKNIREEQVGGWDSFRARHRSMSRR